LLLHFRKYLFLAWAIRDKPNDGATRCSILCPNHCNLSRLSLSQLGTLLNTVSQNIHQIRFPGIPEYWYGQQQQEGDRFARGSYQLNQQQPKADRVSGYRPNYQQQEGDGFVSAIKLLFASMVEGAFAGKEAGGKGRFEIPQRFVLS
jgi:hypothetical protein